MIVYFVILLVIPIYSEIANCIISNDQNCLQCEDGYYLKTDENNMQCQRCFSQCLTCKSQDICQNCQLNFTLFINKCINCQVQGCKMCSSDNICISCNDKYYLSDQICWKCNDNCSQCHYNGVCKQCQNNYILLSSGECIPKSQTDNNNDQSNANQLQSKSRIIKKLRIAITLLVLGGVILIVLICVIRALRKRHRKAQLLRQKQILPPTTNLKQNQQIRDVFDVIPTSYVLLKSSKASNDLKQSNSIKFPSLIGQDMCAICLSDGTDIKTSCSHQFHSECIVAWCNRKKICPDCNNCQFSLKIMCKKCKQFNEKIQLCSSYCKQNNHFLCFKKRTLRKQICQKCQLL